MERGASAPKSRRFNSTGPDTGLALKQKSKINRTEKLILAARAILAWERLWPALWPGLAFVGAWAALALLGVFSFVPVFVHVLLLFGLTVAAIYFFWRETQAISLPHWEEGARRL